MALTIRIPQHGGPEVMQCVDTEIGAPASGEVTIRQTAIGLNYIDTYHRSGVYPLSLPSGLGQEAAGVITAIGAEVADFNIGDRVVYAGGSVGAYAEIRNVSITRLLRLPDDIDESVAAALLLKGMTAYYLLQMSFVVKPGHLLLVHAAAGGVGSVLVPWAKSLGAFVIGTAGSEAKADAARKAGCDVVILYRHQNVADEVKRITNGVGVDVVYDSVGKDTLEASLDSLRLRGLLVSFGNASGKPPPVDPATLMAKGSLFLTRPTLAHYTATRAELDTASQGLFEVLAKGIVKADIGQRYALRDVAQAHADLESRKTVGTTLLIP